MSAYHFINHSSVEAAPDKYTEIEVAVADILRYWSASYFACEWLRPDGTPKPEAELSDPNQTTYHQAIKDFQTSKPIVKPVLGIGLTNTLEIGIGSAICVTASVLGLQALPVHIRRSQKNEIEKIFSKK